MAEVSNTQRQQSNTVVTVISDSGARVVSVDLRHISTLLEAATRAAVEGALAHGVDMPVGAATSKNGIILSATYAQDNLLGDKDAHAELMAIRRTYVEFPGATPDTIAVTLEPCNACQDYLSGIPGLQFIVYVLPRTAASSRQIVRAEQETIFERYQQNKPPYRLIQASGSTLQAVGELLLDVTSRNVDTGETVIDAVKLREDLPEGFYQGVVT